MLQEIAGRLNVEDLLILSVAFVPKLITALLLLLLFWSLYKISRAPLRGLLVRAGLHETLVNMLIDNVYRIGLLIFGLVMAADQVGVNVGAALAGIGVVGLALGFAAQDSLSNIMAGFLIFIDRPFMVGDWVEVAGEAGTVNDITMRSTRIRTLRNTYVIIPNKRIIDEVLENHSQHGPIRVHVPIGIAYKESIPQAREVILPAVRKVEGVLADPAPDVVVMETGNSSVNLQIRVWVAEGRQEMPVFTRALEAAKLALDGAGIQIPFPHLQLFVDSVEERVWNRITEIARPVAS